MGEEQAKSFLDNIGMKGWMLWLILLLVVFNVLMLFPLMKYPEYKEQLAVAAEQGQSRGYERGYEDGYKDGYAEGLSECAKKREVAFEIGKEDASGKGGGKIV